MSRQCFTSTSRQGGIKRDAGLPDLPAGRQATSGGDKRLHAPKNIGAAVYNNSVNPPISCHSCMVLAGLGNPFDRLRMVSPSTRSVTLRVVSPSTTLRAVSRVEPRSRTTTIVTQPGNDISLKCLSFLHGSSRNP
jgi:hypothetical protein